MTKRLRVVRPIKCLLREKREKTGVEKRKYRYRAGLGVGVRWRGREKDRDTEKQVQKLTDRQNMRLRCPQRREKSRGRLVYIYSFSS